MKNQFTSLPLIVFCFLTVHGYSQHLAGGSGHSLSVCSGGYVQAWGNNGSGQLGNGTTTLNLTPVPVNNLSGVVALAAGIDHSLALKNDSTVWAWGNNTNGQLGIGSSTYSPVPVQLTSLSGIVAIASGLLQSYALKSDGTVYAWGANTNGELGNGTNTDSNLPVMVSGLANVIAITSGNSHAMALKNDSTVWSWGSNSFGELGAGIIAISSNVPVQVSNLNHVAEISCGSNHSLALKDNGTVWAWGYNYAGQLGNGNTTNYIVPVQCNIPTDVRKIIGGGNFSLAIKGDSTVWSWGDNYYSQLGNGSAVSYSSLPVPVIPLQKVVEIEAALAHSIAMTDNGILYTWGYNATGQLGNGSISISNVPVSVINSCVFASISEDRDESDNFKIFPSVSDGLFAVEMAARKTNNVHLRIYNSAGRLVLIRELTKGKNMINMKDQSAGIYLCKVSDSNKILFTEKIIKE